MTFTQYEEFLTECNDELIVSQLNETLSIGRNIQPNNKERFFAKEYLLPLNPEESGQKIHDVGC